MNLSKLRKLVESNDELFAVTPTKRSDTQSARLKTLDIKADELLAEMKPPQDELLAERGRLFEEMDSIIRLAEEENREITRSEKIDYLRARFVYDALDRALDGASYRSGRVPSLVDGSGFRGDPWAHVAHESEGQVQSRALRSVELWRADDELKESATWTIERLSEDDRSGVSEHVLIYGSPAYIRAFNKWAAAPETFVAELEPDEHRAWQEAQRHMRATLQLSGAVVPAPLDPTIVLTNDGEINPMREICRVDTTSSKDKRYITSAGATFSFDAELAESSDDTHTETEVTVETHKAQGWIEASLEAAADQEEFSREVAKIIADGKARLEAAKFVTGTGTNQPTGIEVELAGGSSEVSPATAEVFAAAEVYATIEALQPRFRAKARWMAELSTINEIDQFETSNGAKLFPQVGDANPTLLRRALVENSAVDAHSAIDAGATADNFILYVGDWMNYVILDRVGLSVTYIPPGFLRGGNDRPDGRVGWYAYWRVGGESLVDAAFRVLNVATAA